MLEREHEEENRRSKKVSSLATGFLHILREMTDKVCIKEIEHTKLHHHSGQLQFII